MTLGDRLKASIEAAGKSQKEFANELGIAKATLNGYVKNYCKPSPDMLACFSEELGVSIDYLITGKNASVSDNNPYSKHIKAIAHDEGVILTKEQEEAIAEFIKKLLEEEDKRND